MANNSESAQLLKILINTRIVVLEFAQKLIKILEDENVKMREQNTYLERGNDVIKMIREKMKKDAKILGISSDEVNEILSRTDEKIIDVAKIDIDPEIIIE